MGFKRPTRRQLLKSTGVAALTGVAGCTGSSESSGDSGGSSGSSDGGSSSESDDYSLSLRYAHVNSPESLVGKNAARLADEVEKATDGRVTMEVFPAAELGDSSEIIEGIKVGSIDMAHNVWAGLASVKQELAVFDHPYIYEDRDHALRVGDPEQSELLQQFNEDLRSQANMQVIGSVYYGYRQTTMNSKATNPSEFGGKKIRAIPWDTYMATVRGLGARPEPVAFSELSSALATGLVNGQENPLTTIYTNNFQDHQSHLILTSHILSVMPIFMNSGSWEKMSSSDQDAFRDAFKKVTEETRKKTVAREEELIDTLSEEGGMTVIERDELAMDKFKENCWAEIDKKFDWDSYRETIANT